MAETLRLVPERTSLTMELRFVDRAGRYILQQRVVVKYRVAAPRTTWRDVELVKEAAA